MKKPKRLIAPNGMMQHSHIGLVDRDGVFLLLLDSNETKHYRFADSNDAITAISDELDAYKDRCESLEHDIELRNKTVDRLKKRNNALKEHVDALKEQARKVKDD